MTLTDAHDPTGASDLPVFPLRTFGGRSIMGANATCYGGLPSFSPGVAATLTS